MAQPNIAKQFFLKPTMASIHDFFMNKIYHHMFLEAKRQMLVNHEKHGIPLFSPENLQILANAAKECKIAVCLEIGALEIDYCLKNNIKNGELFYFKNGNNVFLVLGRDSTSDPSNYKTWGKAAVVVNPWARDEKVEVFPADQMESHLKNFKGNKITKDKKVTTELEPFNPQKHVLALLIEKDGFY